LARINPHYQKLAAGYLFPEIGRRVSTFQSAHPDANVIRLGIGDVVLPLPASVREAMHQAIDEMGTEAGFRGYPPGQGYDFLREAIIENDFRTRGVELAPEEVFVSDGSKCDSANIQEIFSTEARLAVPDPVYPVYVDTNVMAGRTGAADEAGRYEGIVYLPCTEANDFCPEPPDRGVDLVYLCFPNNPTGAVAPREGLEKWVRYARDHDAVLLYDAAYEAYITEERIPHSIYEVKGAREVAIEFRSFSKGAGFTGVRCAYTVVPRELRGTGPDGKAASVHDLWARRFDTKFNGVSYPVQAGAAATYTPEGKAEVGERVDYYLTNAKIILDGVDSLGLRAFGGVNSPYVWVRTPEGLGSWDLFDRLLERAHVVVTPGAGFGAHGENYIRISSFGKRSDVEEAVERIRSKADL
jgi:LL-diaminopimelate aminotransferase